MNSANKGSVRAAISSDALFGKSKVYIQRALLAKKNQDLDGYQLWAALALELLGKAALASRHPSLIVNPQHPPSLLAAAGINKSANIKTVTAKTTCERLVHLSMGFDRSVRDFCFALFDRRNAELHSGETPLREMNLTVWEGRYWYAVDLMLKMLNSTFFEWLKEEDAEISREIVRQAYDATEHAVRLRIEEQHAGGGQEGDEIVLDTSYEGEWETRCPACEEWGCMVGTQYEEQVVHGRDVVEEYDAEYDMEYHEVVITRYVGEEYYCSSCKLHLGSYVEIQAAGLKDEHSEVAVRVAEYVAEYQNE